MIDGKILGRARQLIQARIKKRQRLFPDELSSKLRGLQLSGNHPIESSRGKKIIRNFFTEELENRAPVIWESLQQAYEASGSQLTETLAFDLKEAATQLLSEITKELSDFMMTQPDFTKDDIEKSILYSAKNDACEEIDIEIDLYVNSLTKKPSETEKSIINIIGKHEAVHGNKKGIGIDELEQEAELLWNQIKSVLNSLGKQKLIEMYKGQEYVQRWLPVEFKDDDGDLIRTVNKNKWKFRLTEKGKQSFVGLNLLPAETRQDTTPDKRREIRAWVWLKELYGLTIERVVKAYLDKYGG